MKDLWKYGRRLNYHFILLETLNMAYIRWYEAFASEKSSILIQ